MKKILLIYLPFCTPAGPSYSITNIQAFLKANGQHDVEILDLNALFHQLKFPEYREYFQHMEWNDYERIAREYQTKAAQVYSENNRAVVDGKKPEYFDILLSKIKEKKPDIVAFSIVYSSQAFYAAALLQSLKEVTKVIGGPAVNEKLIKLADKHFLHEIDFLSYLNGKEVDHQNIVAYPSLDFSQYKPADYFTPQLVVPLRTSTTCYYQQCTFCSHYNKTKYFEFPLENISRTITAAKAKYFFFIDDMIPKQRLLDIAHAVQPLHIRWMCQLRPTKEYDFQTMKTLYDAGLRTVIWGVESANQRILNAMKKGTKKEDIATVLAASHKAGITNGTYIMFGFPTETKEEALETVEFLKTNKENVDLISLSLFGLQKGTPAYNTPELFGISTVTEHQRTVLEPKIEWTVASGMSQQEALAVKKQSTRIFDSINKYPTAMNFFREHFLCRVGDGNF